LETVWSRLVTVVTNLTDVATADIYCRPTSHDRLDRKSFTTFLSAGDRLPQRR
jgi:methylphosphotriester-DNA--protein-cysteine methyltransferase